MRAGEERDMDRKKKRILADYHRQGKKPKELSEKYGVNINTIKSWIRREAASSTGCAGCAGAKEKAAGGAKKRRPGGQPGNTNAVGNRGGRPSIGNANARKHGGYSPVYWDTLTKEEQALIEDADHDAEELLMGEIFLLSIRERRIMLRIRALTEIERDKGGQVVTGAIRSEEKREFTGENGGQDRALYEKIHAEKVQSGELLPGHAYTFTTRTEAAYDVIGRLEEALTRCQAQKQRCIQTLIELRRNRGDDVRAVVENNLLEALVASTKGRIETDDIPELLEAAGHRDDVVEPPGDEGS